MATLGHDVIFDDEFDYCDKTCKSKSGLVVHTKKMHEKSSSKKTFTCDRCNSVFDAHGNLANHLTNCGGAAASSRDMKKCSCGKEVHRANFKRHQRSCGAAVQTGVTRQAGERAVCSMCGLSFSKANLARHQNTCPGRRVVH